ncbi:two-component sensor histidine kinase [Actinomadura rubrobrunea]|uniref:histidine kinase n=1 Tax=Actinomadura rubrobrunea TaxID=115335 RepID=A0A9W6V018_9ACTN|nr:sensor histidine kinase [Actinomadura rubrobrunea]GLW67370.1 two-component sensor histidine kinase [Actinomadura rubrobrunea]
MGAALAYPVIVGNLVPPSVDHPHWWSEAAGLAALAAAVAISRALPLTALVTALALTAVHGNFAFAVPVLAYLTGLRRAHARPVLWGFAGIAAAGAALNLARGIDVTVWFPLTIWLVLLGVLPWLVGRYWRQYRQLVHAGWERAEQLEREQRIVAERERLRERARIAQDMHDSLGHELALLALRAGALQVAPGLDERHRAAAAELRAGAAEATERLRQIIGVLREDTTPGAAPGDDPPVPDAPIDRAAAELADRARASGMSVDLVHDPPPTADTAGKTAEDLPPMVRLAAYRVVQEALTNAAKHAPGAPVRIQVRHHPAGVTVTVTNQAPPTDTPHPLPTGGGHGLTGLTERVRLAGGVLHAGPTPDGGFKVTADLPATPTPPTHTATDPTTATETESARRLAGQRRRLRQSLVHAIAVPSALLAALSTVMVGYYVYRTLNSVLPPSDFAALRIGDDQARTARKLPGEELLNAGAYLARYPEPPGADCRYYRPDANLLGLHTVYRLCFTDGRLSSKNILHTPARPDPPDQP